MRQPRPRGPGDGGGRRVENMMLHVEEGGGDLDVVGNVDVEESAAGELPQL